MKLNKHYKPEIVAAAADDPKVALTNCLIDGNYIVATDGQVLVKLPVEKAEGEPDRFYLSKFHLELARKLTHRKEKMAELGIGENISIEAGRKSVKLSLLKEDEKEKYPNYNSVIPQDTPEYVISVNIDFLARVAKAFGKSNVQLQFFGKTKSIIVKPNANYEGEFGMVMPVQLNNLQKDDQCDQFTEMKLQIESFEKSVMVAQESVNEAIRDSGQVEKSNNENNINGATAE